MRSRICKLSLSQIVEVEQLNLFIRSQIVFINIKVTRRPTILIISHLLILLIIIILTEKICEYLIINMRSTEKSMNLTYVDIYSSSYELLEYYYRVHVIISCFHKIERLSIYQKLYMVITVF